MSHDTTKSTEATLRDPENHERNMQGPRMDDRSPSYQGTSGKTESEPKRRAPVGLKAGRGRQYTWKEKLEARYISKGDGCWEVAGYQLPRNGYVQISSGGACSVDRVVKPAHRVAWELEHGPIPDGLVIAHICDNPRCARPSHLVATTQKENVRDAVRKGRYNTFGQQKLNAEQVLQIRDMSANGDSQKVIAARFGIARNTVSGIVNHKSWAHLTALCDGPRPVESL